MVLSAPQLIRGGFIDKLYKMCYVDFDTAVFRAAKKCQTDFITVTHKDHPPEKWSLEFSGVTKFYGTAKARDGGWIGEQNKKREEEGKPLISYTDFIITEDARLNDSIDRLLPIALEDIDFTVGRIKKTSQAEDYRLCIGGVGNYRHQIAKTLKYKGNRSEKPIIFAEVVESFKKKYKSRVIVCDGIEAEDMVSRMGAIAYKNYQETKEWDTVISFIDKDVKQVFCPQFNYDDTGAGIITPTVQECMTHFCRQLLIGDRSTDNIRGLPGLVPELSEKYGLRKVKGLGETTANKLIEGRSVKEMFEVVVEAYKAYFGEEKKPFEAHTGETLNWNWLDYLRETAILIYLQRSEGEIYDIEDTLKKLKITY